MKYQCSIDLKQLPLIQRNKVMDIVKKSREFYSLDKQVLSVDIKCMKLIMGEL